MRNSTWPGRGSALVALAATSTLLVAGCSAGSLSGGGGDSGGGITLTYLVDNSDTAVASAKAVIAAFQAANPDITVELDTRPGGSDGDNLVKTRLATADMADVFAYNNGSLLQALKPEQNLIPLDDEPWVGELEPTFVASTSGADGKLYGAPNGTAFGGGVLYNIPLYEKLNLEIPKTWDEFVNNLDAVKKAGGITPLEQTYGDTWTAQLLVLADYHNVAVEEPDFAEQYTANKAKYATTPAALRGFEHLQEVFEAGYFNKDFASAKFNDGLAAVATGKAAHYPQIGAVASNLENLAPGKANDVGFFALPGPDASTYGLTIWPANGTYIPKTVEGDRLEAAKKFVAFTVTQEGCDAYVTGAPPVGPFLTSACTLPADVLQVAKDTQAALESGSASPALEFLSPIKGPALEQICVQVGTGQVSGKRGAELYDQDVKKQALQLGLPGWE